MAPSVRDNRCRGATSEGGAGFRGVGVAVPRLRARWGRAPTRGKAGAPEEIRTPDPQIRSLVLYPAELRARAPAECAHEAGHSYRVRPGLARRATGGIPPPAGGRVARATRWVGLTPSRRGRYRALVST